MVFVFYLVLNVLAIFLFVKLKKKLHVLEVILYWMMASYLFQNLSAICYMNFKTLFIPEKLDYEFAHFFNRLILFPIIMITFLHYYLTMRTFTKKLILLTSFVLILLGLEWLADALGVLIHVNWKLWWSIAYWFSVLFVLVVIKKLFRKVLLKGGYNI